MKLFDTISYRLQKSEKDARLIVMAAAAVILATAVVYSYFDARVKKLSLKRLSRERDLVEIMPLKHKYLQAKAEASKMDNRISLLKPDDSISKIVDETGIKGKNLSVRAIPSSEKGVETAEVRVDSLSSNEMVNLLHKIEYGQKPLIIKRTQIKPRFDDPSKLDLSMTLEIKRPENNR